MTRATAAATVMPKKTPLMTYANQQDRFKGNSSYCTLKGVSAIRPLAGAIVRFRWPVTDGLYEFGYRQIVWTGSGGDGHSNTLVLQSRGLHLRELLIGNSFFLLLLLLLQLIAPSACSMYNIRRRIVKLKNLAIVAWPPKWLIRLTYSFCYYGHLRQNLSSPGPCQQVKIFAGMQSSGSCQNTIASSPNPSSLWSSDCIHR